MMKLNMLYKKSKPLPLPGQIEQMTNCQYFSYFSQNTGFEISCKLSPLATIYMKCQILFPGKNKKNISKCCLLKILPKGLSVKMTRRLRKDKTTQLQKTSFYNFTYLYMEMHWNSLTVGTHYKYLSEMVLVSTRRYFLSKLTKMFFFNLAYLELQSR